jgi:ectoine hydroxylase
MDIASMNHRLTEEERLSFEENGYFVVPNALPLDLVKKIEIVMDRLDAEYRPIKEKGTYDPLAIHDFIGKDPIFLELLDCPKTFLKVCEILGWNIQLYHSDYRYSPPTAQEERTIKKRFGWHQDSGRLNRELDGEPKSRVSLKVAFFISDTSQPNRGNFHVMPGSHLKNKIDIPEDGISNPQGATAMLAAPGTAVFFDRRIWHAASPNHSDITRKVLFYGYSYRWLRPRDNMTVDHIIDKCDPIRQQLLGASANGGFGYTSPKDEDVPLKLWMEEHLEAESIPS